MRVRNPVYSPGLMPVVTPLDPSVNSSHQLSLSAAAVTQSEIWRATRLAPVRSLLLAPRSDPRGGVVERLRAAWWRRRCRRIC